MVKSAKASQKSLNISKGVIFIFFTIYLIIFGIIISDFFVQFQSQNPGGEDILPVFLSYIPLLCYIGAAFLGIGFIVFIRNISVYKTRETQSRKKIKKGSIYKQALFLIIFIFAFIPLLAPIVDQGKNTQHFSIYNSNWNGCSDLRETLESQNYNVMSLQSSLSATERLDKRVLLILMGPNQYYDPIFEIPYFIDFFNSTNSLMICHDRGSTTTLLWEIFIASLLTRNQTIPLTIFPNGVLRDHLYYETTPEYPLIQDFDDTHPITSGINEVILGQATAALGGEFVEAFGWDALGYSSIQSYIDKDGDDAFDNATDVIDLSFIHAIVPVIPSRLALGIHQQAVFMATDTGNLRLFVSGDASLFNNELIEKYDNRRLAVQIIEWLTYIGEGGNKDDWVIVFDEAHIRPEYSRDLTSAGIYGYIMQYIIHLSTNPITLWIYPLIAYYTLRRYLPRKDEKKEKKEVTKAEKQEEIAKFRTSSFFAQKIEWYKEKSKYGKALTLLYRRLERKLHILLKGNKITSKNVIDMVIAKDPGINKLKLRRIGKFMDKILLVKEGKDKIKNEQDFENLFFEMEWVINNI
jgi:hypothetical protein